MNWLNCTGRSWPLTKTCRLFLGQWFRQDFWDASRPYIFDKIPLGCAFDFLVHFNIFNLLCWRDTAPKQSGMASFMEQNADKYVKMIFLKHVNESKINFASDCRIRPPKDWHKLCYFMWVFSSLFICRHSGWIPFHLFPCPAPGLLPFPFLGHTGLTIPASGLHSSTITGSVKSYCLLSVEVFQPIHSPSPRNSFSHSPTWFNPDTSIIFVTGIILF